MGNYLVTGANGGLGRAVCRALAEAGHKVWGIDRSAAEETPLWRCVRADITQTEALGRAFERIRPEAGALDGIIHTAGIYDLNSLIEMPEEDFLRDFNVNLFGVFRVNRLFAPLLREKGRIVIVSSELAPLGPLPFTGIYAVTKAAVEKYAAALSMELQLTGRSVVVIRPGAIDTPLLSASTDSLARFCENTRLYRCDAGRFRRIVDSVEARSVPPEKVAALMLRGVSAAHARLVYSINRNPLLLILNSLPRRIQLWIIRRVLRG